MASRSRATPWLVGAGALGLIVTVIAVSGRESETAARSRLAALRDAPPVSAAPPRERAPAPDPFANATVDPASNPFLNRPTGAGPPAGASDPGSEGGDGAVARDPEYWRYADIEELKQAIYALDIDSVEQLDQLDEFVSTDGIDPRDLWDTGWGGVDDWKRYEDGFRLETGDDGALIFVPDEETMRMYTFFESDTEFEYDAEVEAFVNQVDYYGKPVVNVVKFLRDDVLVRMTVSGEKVDLNLYQQDPARRE